MNAKEAQNAAYKYCYLERPKKLGEFLDEILFKIERSAKKGEYYTLVYPPCEFRNSVKEISDILAADGFKVKACEESPLTLEISWYPEVSKGKTSESIEIIQEVLENNKLEDVVTAINNVANKTNKGFSDAKELKDISDANPRAEILAKELVKESKEKAYEGFYGCFKTIEHLSDSDLPERISELLKNNGFEVILEKGKFEEGKRIFVKTKVHIYWYK